MLKICKYLGLIIVFLIIVTIVLSNYSNFHTVIPNQVYRSAQLNQKQLTYYVHKYQIKSILNLRGTFQNKAWYINEVNTSKNLNTQHYDVKMLPLEPNTPERLRDVAQILLTAPKPILIHCAAGADRTSFISAMALILLKNLPVTTAKKQIALFYGVVSPNSIGPKEFNYYEAWLKSNNLPSSRENFLRWLAALKKFAPGVGYSYNDK